MRFTKMHGAGNDYIYIDARKKEYDWPDLAIAMSDRHKGIGSDGLILLRTSNQAHIRMTMFNSDGSEGDMCGNGIRCLVRYALDQGALPRDISKVMVETASGVLEVSPAIEGGKLVRARVKMGQPEFRTDLIPVDIVGQQTVIDHPFQVEGHKFEINCVSMGNPHAVAFIDRDVDQIPLADIGPVVERNNMFPNRVNFEIANIIDPTIIKARVWERGSGLTMACGTGACAIVATAHVKGLVENKVLVQLPGGDLIVEWPGHGDIFLDGPVEEVFEGEWSD